MMYPRWFQLVSRADFVSSAGLYVTRDHLFLVRLRKDLFRLSVVEEEVREIEPGGGGPMRRQLLFEAVRSLLPHFHPAREPLYLCLSPDQAIAYQISLPQAAEENLTQVLDYEIERVLPFRRDEVYYDFLPLGRKANEIGVLLFAVRKKTLDEILDVLSAFDVRPERVEATSTALTNYLLFCDGEISGPAVVLGGENQSWEMTGLHTAGHGWKRKPEILFTHWLPQADWALGPSRELFQGLLREAPRFFGWGTIHDLLSAVEGESVNVTDLTTFGKDRVAPNKGMADSLFIPAAGSALHGVREATFSVNLLPGSIRKRERRTLSRLNALLSLVLLIGLAILGGSYVVKDEIRLRQLKNESSKIGPSLEALRRQEEELTRLRNEISFLAGFKERRGEILRVLDELSRIVPNSAYLSNLRFRDGTVELQGNAENTSNLVPILERSPLFKNVGFNAPSNRGRDNRETFSLKAELERAEEKALKP
ncbi:MAG: PilN domain-containing protein [Candidatus Binatia bacterium]